MIIHKRKLFVCGVLLGALALAAPAAHALSQESLKLEREIQALETEFARTPIANETRTDLVREIRERKRELSNIAQEAEVQRRLEMRKPADNRIVERQVQILEESGRFTDEELARMRNNPVIERLDTRILADKQQRDLSFKEEIDTINKLIAQHQAEVKTLQAKRSELIKVYHQDIKDLALKEDLPLRPITIPVLPETDAKPPVQRVIDEPPATTKGSDGPLN